MAASAAGGVMDRLICRNARTRRLSRPAAPRLVLTPPRGSPRPGGVGEGAGVGQREGGRNKAETVLGLLIVVKNETLHSKINEKVVHLSSCYEKLSHQPGGAAST